MPDPFLDKLVGEWRIERDIRGEILENSMDVRWVLEHQFVQMHMTDVNRPPEYEAIVLVGFESEKNRYVAHWCDSFGAGYSAMGVGVREGDSVEFRFEYDDGPFFNRFTWHPAAGTWTFRGENGQPDGSRTLFMQDVARKRR